jgi:hypothetical protein
MPMTQPQIPGGVALGEWATWSAFVSDASKIEEGTLPCPRCKDLMKEVLRIAPAQTDPGLIAYECRSCGYVTSVLTPSGPERSLGRG